MKKVLFTAVSALAASAAVATADSTQFGALKVPSTAKQTIVAVPWFQSSTSDTPVTVSNLVLTASFSAGDSIVLFEDGEYSKAWTLKDGAWVGASIVISGKTIPAGTDQDTLERGSTLLVKRERDNITDGFYLIGKPATSGIGAVTLPSGSATSPVYALVAPPTTAAANINKAGTWSGLTKAMDRLIIDRNGTTEILTWNGEFWGSKTHKNGGEITIPEGQGAWFISYGEGTKTVTW